MSHSTAKYRLIAAALLIGSAAIPLNGLNYTVQPADTLFGLSLEYDVPQSWIIRANNLSGESLRIGQEIEIPVEGFHSITVQPGDTLSGLSVLFDVSVQDIMAANNMENPSLGIGQELKIPEAAPPGQYRVAAGDTLTAIARYHGISVAALKAYNGLRTDVIRPGEFLKIAAPHPETYVVGDGESLWTIANKFGLPMEDLKKWNSIDGNIIHPGEILALFPGIEIQDFTPSAVSPETENNLTVVLAAVSPEKPEKKENDIPRFGEYYYSPPKAAEQPNDSYWEEPNSSALTDYYRGRAILEELEIRIAETPNQSKALSGWHIVIDPGHGGMDPGAIVTVKDGNGDPLTVTEDEYAYDIALRIYRSLSLHGASVSLTTLAPDHEIRNGDDPRRTFVHRKNEVYNDRSHNGNAAWRPVGTAEGLDLRKNIAASQIADVPLLDKRKGTLFISIHADNSPDLPAGRAVLFDGINESETEDSRDFASVLAKNLGGGAFIKQQPLRVLRDNPADAAILVEMRNVSYPRNCWALRSAELREQDALMVVDGILEWCSR